MNVLGISGSPRKGGNTDILLETALSAAREAGAETEMLAVRDWRIESCDGCKACTINGKCRIKDDMQKLYPKLLNADGIIFGTPVYMHSMTGILKIFVERTMALAFPTRRLANKVVGVVMATGRDGVTTTSGVFYIYLANMHMFATDFVHAFGVEKGDVRKDKHGMKSAWELGRKLTLLAKTAPRYPEEYGQSLTTYVQEKYGLPGCPISTE